MTDFSADRDEEVRQLAYRLWEAAGQPEGRADEFWYEADRQLAGHSNGQATPAAPADPHPADENPSNVYNPAPGAKIVSEQHSADLESNPKNLGSTA